MMKAKHTPVAAAALALLVLPLAACDDPPAPAPTIPMPSTTSGDMPGTMTPSTPTTGSATDSDHGPVGDIGPGAPKLPEDVAPGESPLS